ncbi:MAG: ABC transporter ATP-binding protein [Caldilineae bacterium]|nr:MAG: ABC transporter ATP-binding protein [Caldilineae bacterium]
MIEARGLTKKFADFTAVDHIDLSVAEGEVLALLGPNGAGKTTTIRMLGSILKPTSGYATIAGLDTVRQAKEVRRVVGLLTEFPGLYTRMKGLEYLDFFGELQGLPAAIRRERAERLLRQFELWEARDKRLGEYSKGMKQKLTLVRAMLHDPAVLFLDEPTSNMDPQSAKLVRDAILSLRAERRTIILCTHNLPEAELLADRIAIIRRGQIVAEGSPSSLKQQLLGHPVMEVRLAEPLNGHLEDIADVVDVVAAGENWFRYVAPQPAQINPRLLQMLAHRRTPVVTLSEVPHSLEEVYLRIVQETPQPEVQA